MGITREDIDKRVALYKRDLESLNSFKCRLNWVCQVGDIEQKQAAQKLLAFVKSSQREIGNKIAKILTYKKQSSEGDI